MIPTLPNEVWSHIFSQISHGKATMEDDRCRSEEGSLRYTILYNLCLVSRSFKYLAEPFLYDSFTPRYGHSLVWWSHVILSNPRLAKHVRQVKFSPLDDFQAQVDDDKVRYQFFLQLAQNLTITDKTASLPWSEFDHPCAIFRGSMWLLLQLLIVKLPNLEKMKINTPSPAQFPLFWTTTNLPPPNLRELRIEWDDGLEDQAQYLDDEVGVDLFALGGLFALPKLEKPWLNQFVGSSARDKFGADRTAPVHLPPNENVKWLRSSDSLIDRKSLNKLVTALPNLEVFEYQAGSFGSFYGAPEPTFGSSIAHALKPLRSKLKTLNLNCARQDDWPTLYKDACYPTRSLFKFTCLERLNVDMMLVLGKKFTLSTTDPKDEGEEDENAFYEYFPPALKSLTITHAVDKLISPLSKLSNDVNSWLPNLTEIRWQFGTGVIDDKHLVNQLSELHPGEETIPIQNWHIPARYTRLKIDEEGSVYCETNIPITFLPPLWREIAEHFIAAGIRVKIGHGYTPPIGRILFEGVYESSRPFKNWVDIDPFMSDIELEHPDQMGIWKWWPDQLGEIQQPFTELQRVGISNAAAQLATAEFPELADPAFVEAFLFNGWDAPDSEIQYITPN